MVSTGPRSTATPSAGERDPRHGWRAGPGLAGHDVRRSAGSAARARADRHRVTAANGDRLMWSFAELRRVAPVALVLVLGVVFRQEIAAASIRLLHLSPVVILILPLFWLWNHVAAF